MTAYLRSAAGRAAAEGLRSAQTAAAASAEPAANPVDLGFVFALRLEAPALLAALKGVRTLRGAGFKAHLGELRGRSVAVVIGGPGSRAARRATQALLDGHRPRYVVSAGLAGGLDPELRPGDLVLADRVGDAAGRWLSLDLRCEPADSPAVRVGRLLSVDRVVCLSQEKRALGQEHQALAVDMETFAVAETCRTAGVPLVAVRVICDAADEDLPRDVERLLRQRTAAARAGAALGSLVRRPAAAADLWRLKERADQAAGRLGGFLASLVLQFPASGA
jgi:adenosylhomocysteine nucleosidase